jgi:ribose/xylose/arabinose/galactoside ABC-type transport system permease subunit
VYAIGSDPVAATLSGVSRRATMIKVYAFSGFCAAAAGVFISTQTASGSPTVGDPFILEAVAATVIGGTSLFGGRGGFAGAVAGAFVFTLIDSVTFQLGINSDWGQLSQGLLLILAVALHHASARTAQARGRRRR